MEWVAYLAPNGEDESYLRYLQLAGYVGRYPWSLRGFSADESMRLATRVAIHPWTRSPKLTSTSGPAKLLPFVAELRGNSTGPYGYNDGAVWAGRGMTAVVTAGAAFRVGPLTLTVAPLAFITQNAEFDLLENGQPPDSRFADGLFPTSVDRPQRFGENPYGRVDGGNSTARVDVAGLTAGVSTANMAWGPFERYPYVLGTSAGGFPHAFVGTSRALSLGVGLLHGKVVWGRLEQTPYSPVKGEARYVSHTEPGTRRFGSGMVMVFMPRGVAGLELGLSRFFHSPWPRSGLPRSHFLKPFEGLLKEGVRGTADFGDGGTSAENQVASGFVRWAFSPAAFEMYAEYGREDHSWDKRDFVVEPDHSRSYGLGLRKTLRVKPSQIDGLTIEIMNFQLPHLARTGRGEGGLYIHTIMRQGHTNRGQLLGADVAVGAGAASTIRWDRYVPQGRRSIALHRMVRQDRGLFFAFGTVDPKSSHVQYALEFDRSRRRENFYLTTRLAVVHDFNRNFKNDVTGVSASVVLTRP